MTIANAIALLGGLGFFLFGMSLLGDGLKRVAGSKLENILGKLTSTAFRGVILGAIVTAVIQSSSATTVMVVGFVNSGIMQLGNAIGVVMGANIGTTATGWILALAGVEGGGSFSSSTVFAFIAFVGIILYFFCKSPAKKNVGLIMLAFSVLMSGMKSMSGAMEPLKESQFFLNFISAVSNPIVSILVGVVVTAIIQSCSASIGILQALSVTGVISYDVALPMVIGMCIGACVPVLISAVGANVNGKRAAFVYLYFNLSGAILLMIPFYIIHAFADFSFMSATASYTGIAIVNTAFKVIATAVLCPMAGLLEKLAVATIKEKPEHADTCPEDDLLDERFLSYPSLALEQSGKTLKQMADVAFESFELSLEILSTYFQDDFDRIMAWEDKADRYEDVLGAYLVRLNASSLTEKETQTAARYLTSIGNLERISDHAVNLAELAKELADKKISFSDRAKKEFEVCLCAAREIVSLTKASMERDDFESARMIEPLEEVMDIIVRELKNRHIQRVQEGVCTLELGFIYGDCLTNIERVADHCSNLAIAVLESEGSHIQSHDYLRHVKEEQTEAYRQNLSAYAAVYYDKLTATE
ncbi:MAG: Na/Pi cotransporter family protein [Oscillospiraceae bacterium]|nr:Na/Pi cotransporter family protein [Oscillospiraceae bacterium]